MAGIIHPPSHRLVRWMRVEFHRAGQFLDKMLVVRQLEAIEAMWLEAMRPDPLHRRRTDSCASAIERALQ